MTNRTNRRRRRTISTSLLAVVVLQLLSTLCDSASTIPQIECHNSWGIQCRGGAQENQTQPKKKSLFSAKTWFQRSKPPIKDLQTRPETKEDHEFPTRSVRPTSQLPRPLLVRQSAERSLVTDSHPGDEDEPVLVHSVEMSFAQKAASLLGHSKGVPPPPRGTLPQDTRFETVSVGMDRSQQPSMRQRQSRSNHHGHALVELILAEESRAHRFTGATKEIDKSLFNYMDPMEIYASVVSEYFEPDGEAIDNDMEVMDYFEEGMYSSESDELSDYDVVEETYGFDDELGAIADRLYASTCDSEEIDGTVDCDSPSLMTDVSVADLVLDSTDELVTMRSLQPVVVIRPRETQTLRRTVTKTRRVPRQTLLSSLDDFDLDDDEFDLLLDDMNSSALIEEEYDVYEYDELDPYAVEQVACIMMLPRTSNLLPMDEESIDVDSTFLLPFTGCINRGEDNEEDSEETDDNILLASTVPVSWEYPDYDRLSSNESEVNLQDGKEIEAESQALVDIAVFSEKTEMVPSVPRVDLHAGSRRAPNTPFKPKNAPVVDETDDVMGSTDWEILRASDLFNHASEFEDDIEESEGELEYTPEARSKAYADLPTAGEAPEQLPSIRRAKPGEHLPKDTGATTNIPPPPPTSDRKDERRIPPPPLCEQRNARSVNDHTAKQSTAHRIPPPPAIHRRHISTGWKGRSFPEDDRDRGYQRRVPPPPPPKERRTVVDWNSRTGPLINQEGKNGHHRIPPPPPPTGQSMPATLGWTIRPLSKGQKERAIVRRVPPPPPPMRNKRIKVDGNGHPLPKEYQRRENAGSKRPPPPPLPPKRSPKQITQ